MSLKPRSAFQTYGETYDGDRQIMLFGSNPNAPTRKIKWLQVSILVTIFYANKLLPDSPDSSNEHIRSMSPLGVIFKMIIGDPCSYFISLSDNAVFSEVI